MAYGIRISTGMPGFDQVIDGLRLGDNVVWQVQVASDYAKMVTPYVRQALACGRLGAPHGRAGRFRGL